MQMDTYSYHRSLAGGMVYRPHVHGPLQKSAFKCTDGTLNFCSKLNFQSDKNCSQSHSKFRVYIKNFGS